MVPENRTVDDGVVALTLTVALTGWDPKVPEAEYVMCVVDKLVALRPSTETETLNDVDSKLPVQRAMGNDFGSWPVPVDRYGLRSVAGFTANPLTGIPAMLPE